jgi:hypothetical protein
MTSRSFACTSSNWPKLADRMCVIRPPPVARRSSYGAPTAGKCAAESSVLAQNGPLQVVSLRLSVHSPQPITAASSPLNSTISSPSRSPVGDDVKSLWAGSWSGGAASAGRRVTDNLPSISPNQRAPDVEAGSIGIAMIQLNATFKVTHDDKYLSRAEWFAAWAVKKFWPADKPLPRASVRENIYSAASRCDTLAMSMLQTSLLRHQPEKEAQGSLIATDR